MQVRTLRESLFSISKGFPFWNIRGEMVLVEDKTLEDRIEEWKKWYEEYIVAVSSADRKFLMPVGS